MGAIVSLPTIGETLVFGDEASSKHLELLNRLVLAARRLKAAQSSQEKIYLENENIIQAQMECAEASARLEFVADALDATHRQRCRLLEAMPEHEAMILVVSNDDETRSMVSFTKRKGAAIFCPDFQIVETTQQGSHLLFPRQALR